MLAGERFAGGAHRVELVGLRTVAPRGALRPVDLHDPLAVFEQIRRQPSAEAAGALDGPNPPVRGVFAAEGEHAAVAKGVGGYLNVSAGAASAVDHGQRVVIAVGVDTDHVVGVVGEHPQRFVLPFRLGCRTGIGQGVTARRDCDETRPFSGSVGLLIRPAIRWTRPVPVSRATYPTQRHVLLASVTFGSDLETGGKPDHRAPA